MSQIQHYMEALAEDFYAKFGFGVEYDNFIQRLDSLDDEEIMELCKRQNIVVKERD